MRVFTGNQFSKISSLTQVRIVILVCIDTSSAPSQQFFQKPSSFEKLLKDLLTWLLIFERHKMAYLRSSLLLVQLFDINEKKLHFSYLKKSNVIVTSWMVVFGKLNNPTECNSLLVLISSASSSLMFSNISVHMVYSVIEGISVNKHESIYYLTNLTFLKLNP